MSDDIFHSWKNSRFIVADSSLGFENSVIIVLTDIEYWNDNYEELKDWCDENLAEV